MGLSTWRTTADAAVRTSEDRRLHAATYTVLGVIKGGRTYSGHTYAVTSYAVTSYAVYISEHEGSGGAYTG